MKNFKLLITISTLILGTSTVFAASHAGAPMAKDDAKKAMPMAASADMAEGEVRKIDKENKKITLKHGVIKNLDMPGMTMVFQVKDTSLLDNIKAGDKIKFTADNVNGAMTVLSVQKNP